MEFETNRQPTPDDVIQAETPRITLQPVHSNVSPDALNTPNSADLAAETIFEFDSESTQEVALAAPMNDARQHHIVAVLFAFLITAIFIGALVVVILTR